MKKHILSVLASYGKRYQCIQNGDLGKNGLIAVSLVALEHEQEFEYVKLETMKNVTVVFQQAQKTGNATVKRVQVLSNKI